MSLAMMTMTMTMETGIRATTTRFGCIKTFAISGNLIIDRLNNKMMQILAHYNSYISAEDYLLCQWLGLIQLMQMARKAY